MKPYGEIEETELLNRKLLDEAYKEEDPVKRYEVISALSLRAKQLKCKTEFSNFLKVYEKELEAQKAKKEADKRGDLSLLENWTNFSGAYDNMRCRNWIASDKGILKANGENGYLEVTACYHPILPIERLKNLETGEEQIKIAYKRNNIWSEIIVPKTMITSASKIVNLSARGVSVTSETAKNLVRFLSDVENDNEEAIKIQYSSGKVGWVSDDNTFLPYDTNIVFDGDNRFGQLFNSIKEKGNKEVWYNHMKELRASGKMEVKIMLAASFASVLVKILGGLPFFVDLWGETEGGKSVTLMVAASVWANPAESAYIGDFKTTDTALEARADMLNSLPVMLDDTSKTSERIRGNFEGIVYDLCSGKGKSRSNKELGINRENRWQNCFLTNGERPLSEYVKQGGAVNRILEIECGNYIFSSPQKTAETVKANYGFAGKDFVEIVKMMGIDQIRDIYNGFQQKLQDDNKMQKQSQSLAIVLTADKIVTDYMFKDGHGIALEEAKEVLVDRKEVSENIRCYAYILDMVNMNAHKFDIKNENTEKWGILKDGYAIFYPTAFAKLCKDGGFSEKTFLAWAAIKGVIKTEKGRKKYAVKFDGKTVRCVVVSLTMRNLFETQEESKELEEGFMELEEGQEIPFN